MIASNKCIKTLSICFAKLFSTLSVKFSDSEISFYEEKASSKRGVEILPDKLEGSSVMILLRPGAPFGPPEDAP